MLSSLNSQHTGVFAFSPRSVLFSPHGDQFDRVRAIGEDENEETCRSLPITGGKKSFLMAGKIHDKFPSDPLMMLEAKERSNSVADSELVFDFDTEKNVENGCPCPNKTICNSPPKGTISSNGKHDNLDIENLSIAPKTCRAMIPSYRLPPKELSQKNIIIHDEDTNSSDDENEEVASKVKGHEHKIANRKLLSLLTSLDGDKRSTDDKIISGLKVGSLPASSYLGSSQSRTNIAKSGTANFNFLRGSTSKGKIDCSIKRWQSAPALGDPDLDITITVSNKVTEKPGVQEVPLRVDEDSEGLENATKYKRSSSLKSGKTPPGSPGGRKIVRFADLFGLDLADIKMFVNEVPRVPKSAFLDLTNADLSDMDSDSSSATTMSTCTYGSDKLSSARTKYVPPRLKLLFAQPGGTPTMYNNLRDRKVSLESVIVCDESSVVKGMVRVANLAFDKRVFVRYTTDDWHSYRDVPCSFMCGTCDGFADKFSFVLDCSNVMGKVGGRLQFCISFHCLGNVYWDSNNGGNYVFQYFSGYQNPNFPAACQPLCSTASVNVPSSNEGIRTHTFSQMANSPTTFNDDPWLQYL